VYIIRRSSTVLPTASTLVEARSLVNEEYFYIGLCRRGRTLGHYDYKPTDFKAGDICWLMPDHVVSHHSVTDDYSVLSVFITREYFQRLKERVVLGKYHYLHHTPLISLTPSQFDTIYQAFLLLGRLAESDSPHRTIAV